MRRLATATLTLALTAAAAGCGGGGSNTQTKSTPKPAPAQPVQITMRNGGPHPKVGKNWPLTLTVTHAGKPVASAKVSYEFLLGGSIVARPPATGTFRHGRYHDELTFPAAAVGHAVTFRAVVKTPFGTAHADQPIDVRK